MIFSVVEMMYKPERALTLSTKKVPDRASSKGRAIRQVEILSNKLLTTAFEASTKKVPDPGTKL